MSQPVHLERKTIVGSLLTLLATGAIAVLNGLNGSALLQSVPAWAQGLIVTLVPTLVVFLGQYVTSHTERPDLAPTQDAPAAQPVVLDAEPV